MATIVFHQSSNDGILSKFLLFALNSREYTETIGVGSIIKDFQCDTARFLSNIRCGEIQLDAVKSGCDWLFKRQVKVVLFNKAEF